MLTHQVNDVQGAGMEEQLGTVVADEVGIVGRTGGVAVSEAVAVDELRVEEIDARIV